jgi:hypothetical protein
MVQLTKENLIGDIDMVGMKKRAKKKLVGGQKNLIKTMMVKYQARILL